MAGKVKKKKMPMQGGKMPMHEMPGGQMMAGPPMKAKGGKKRKGY